MRGSFDALAGAVRRLGLDPVDGHLYLFLNKRRRIAKAVWFDGSGWCVLAKRLEAGSFQLPLIESADTRVQIDGATFPPRRLPILPRAQESTTPTPLRRPPRALPLYAPVEEDPDEPSAPQRRRAR